MSNGRYKLYSAYRTKDDAILCFEETADRAAEILGIKRSSLYEHVSRQRKEPDKKWRYRIEETLIKDLE